MRLVIAATKTAYELYRDKYHLSPNEVKWVTNPDGLRGYHYEDTIVVAVGNWYESDMATKVNSAALEMGYNVIQERI